MRGTNFDMEKLDISIRTASRDDVARILEIFEKAAASQADAIPLDSNRSKLTVNVMDRDGFDTRDRAAYFQAVVAETKDVHSKGRKLIVGAATYHFKYSTWVGQVVHLGSVAVDQVYQRKGVATKILKYLGKMAVENKFLRISFEVSDKNEAAIQLFDKIRAKNLTKEEGWLNFSFTPETVDKIIHSASEPVPDDIVVRRTEPKDCQSILAFIRDLATFEKMPDGPKLSVADLQRDGFYKLFPLYLSHVAERTDPDTGEKEIIGYSIYFPTYSPHYGKRIHLEDVYVDPRYRSRGVASSIFQALAKVIFILHVLYITHTSYLKLIFQTIFHIHNLVLQGKWILRVHAGVLELERGGN
ncbi:unnamed protein product [Orchesella dallaii]|uniref:N-acetyltransferase domain-containing protein n=1 Tax=Orchesella dallaii TaxID=48710 RepID=A0ABP1Q9R7_9HEXA